MTHDSPLSGRVERLEAIVERQAETIDGQRDRTDELERDIDSSDGTISRRMAPKAGGLAGLLALGSGVASADPQDQIGTAGDPLVNNS